MKRVASTGVAVCAALAAAGGCQSKPGAPNPGSGTGSEGTPGSATAAGPSPAAPIPSNPTAALVKDAFGGNVPAFPLLARDGSAVAIGIASPIGRSDVATYNVLIFTGWTAMTDAWGSSAQAYPIVDLPMATMLLDSAMGEAAPAPDLETLKARAAGVSKRLTGGEFSPFDRPAAALGPNDTAFGPVKLRVTHDAEAALTVHMLDGSGNAIAQNTILRKVMGHVADLECVSTPVARRAWLDTSRKRILVEVGWNAGPEMCSAPDPEYGVWPFP